MKEFKVGERITVTLEVVEQKDCKGCFFEGEDGCCGATSLGLECVPKYRSDGKNVIFKEVKNMDEEERVVLGCAIAIWLLAIILAIIINIVVTIIFKV